MASITKRNKQKPESFHHLISALSYRASIGRTLLFMIILAPFFAYIVGTIMQSRTFAEAAAKSFLPLVLIVGAFFSYDLIYVTVASNAPIKKTLDKCILFAVELGALTVILLPLMWLEVGQGFKSMYAGLLIAITPIFILLVRILIGVRANQMKMRGR